MRWLTDIGDDGCLGGNPGFLGAQVNTEELMSNLTGAAAGNGAGSGRYAIVGYGFRMPGGIYTAGGFRAWRARGAGDGGAGGWEGGVAGGGRRASPAASPGPPRRG